MLQLVQTINSYLSDCILIVLPVGTGLFFSAWTRFVQVRCFNQIMVLPNVIALITLSSLVAAACKKADR